VKEIYKNGIGPKLGFMSLCSILPDLRNASLEREKNVDYTRYILKQCPQLVVKCQQCF